MKSKPESQIDFYKTGHKDQYPEGTELVYANWTPRKSRDPNIDKVVFFGLQYFIKEYLINQWDENFFRLPKEEVVKRYKRRMDTSLGPDMVPTSHIAALHDKQYLPIVIKALDEGTLCPIRVPMFTISNTEPDFFWLTNYLETILSCSVWLPCTSATTALQYKKIFTKYAKQTNPEAIDFVSWQGHDFSMRGMAGLEAACMSGAGHLLSFTGTDTIPAIDFLEEYYKADGFVGGSVPATEHSVMSLSGKDDELGTFDRLISKVHPNGIVSIVSDTWNLWTVLTEYLPALKEKVLSREGKVVVRPDCYDEETEIFTNSGWKKFKDLNNQDLVAEVKDNHYSFVKPEKIINQPYEGLMYKITDHFGKVDMLVTPNHRIVLDVEGVEKVLPADNFKVAYYKKMWRSAAAKSSDNRLSDLDRLKIAFQADGSYQSGHKNKIRFSFAKERKIGRLINLLERMNYKYKIYNLADERVEISINTEVENFQKNLNWVQLDSLTKEWCMDFIEECSNWDGHERSENRLKIDSTNQSVINVIEIVAMSAGYGVFVSKYEDNRSEKYSDVYTANILKNNLIGTQNLNIEKVEYNGNVYCVKVGSGKILVRRNRSILVSGNSGDPVKIICGDPDGKTEQERKGVIQLLWDTFGGTISSTGYKVLDSHVGAIYGDSITLKRGEEICRQLKENGFASTNIVFGIGSYTYQYTTRDQFGFAMKATYGVVNGEARNIFKDPVTDDGMKKSAKGLIQVVNNGGLSYIDECENDNGGELQTVFINGKLVKEHSLSEIRDRLDKAT